MTKLTKDQQQLLSEGRFLAMDIEDQNKMPTKYEGWAEDHDDRAINHILAEVVLVALDRIAELEVEVENLYNGI